LLILFAVVWSGCATTPAGTGAPNPLVLYEAQLEGIRARQKVAEDEVARTKEAAQKLTASLQQMTQRLQTAEATVADLRTQIERKAVVAPATATAMPPAAQATVPSAGAEQSYAEALARFRARRYEAAARQFSEFIERFPRHPLAGNAQYWIGESRYGAGDFPQAIVELKKVLELPSSARKAPDALLMIGQSYRALNRPRRARDVLQQVVQEYPRSPAARKARQILRSIP
jgi:tol-pal system protein YbgF